jgi:hypothetical protein
MKRDILKNLFAVVLCLLFVSSLAACGGSGGGDGDVAGSTVGQGTLSTSLTDSSTDEYQAVYVTITRVEVHHDSGGTWQTVAEPNQTYNLLELVNGVRETLGIASMDAGHYTQMRLIIGETAEAGSLNIFSVPHPFANYVIDLNGVVHELKVPSGTNTGLKVVNGFEINENQTTELILDFDAMRSVVKAGASGKYLLKPTIKVLNTTEYAIASGQVTDADMAPAVVPLEGAMVSAQVADTSQPDAKDQVVIEAGTLTDMNGDYALFLAPGNYKLVATQAGYLPACIATSLSADEVKTMTDFSLSQPTGALGNITGTVTITNAQTDQYATIDFRQMVTCVNDSTAAISVKTINIADGGDYSVGLPAGTYQVVSSTFGKVTVTDDVTVDSDMVTTQNIELNTAAP